ncbi:hypothetical protein LTR84_004756 [Exophiala bonariae]|uniref:Uncharacterized protein n=1 Tax=Exophiala bonariae TaxID=1690606 RepID=A0AAV9NNS0_9EURO|nr:hypothetical protein LTR84_004756 [Exophiala bonariae]
MSELSEEVFVRLMPAQDHVDVDMIDAPAAFNGNSNHAAPLQASTHMTESTFVDQSEPSIAVITPPVDTPSKFIIAVDFGTTFSKVAFVCVDPEMRTRLIGPDSIHCIDHYPDIPIGISANAFTTNTSIPTELWYPLPKARVGPSSLPEPIPVDDDSDSSLEREWASSTKEDSEVKDFQPSTTQPTRLVRPAQVWGYAVQNKIVQNEGDSVDSRHITRFKLMLDESDVTQTIRQAILNDVKTLKSAKIITQPVDLITDYLTQLFQHTKSQLEQSHALREDSSIELVLCVPTLWSEKACRTMQIAIARALEASTLAKTEQGSVDNLFLVTEPEAAAAFALSGSRSLTHKRDTIQILDCGGGTVDAITYTVTQTNPLRLREVVPPKGGTFGSSFLNERLTTLLSTRLSGVELLGNSGSLDSIIRAAVVNWENGIKRKIDVTNKDQYIDSIQIYGLRADPARRFAKNRVLLDRKELKDIFRDSLMGITDIMRGQLRAADDKELTVSRVLLIGGFGQSPSLKSHLEKVLYKERNYQDLPIQLERPDYVDSAVARGAVLRALRKEDGPIRITRTSYGVLHSEYYNKSDPKHQGLRGTRDPADGQLYIKDTINWLIFKVTGRRVASKTREMRAEEAGRIIVDLTPLKAENKIQPERFHGPGDKVYEFYEVEFDLWLIVEGRNLRFEARSPQEPHSVEASAQFSIAAGFVPGTV